MTTECLRQLPDGTYEALGGVDGLDAIHAAIAIARANFGKPEVTLKFSTVTVTVWSSSKPFELAGMLWAAMHGYIQGPVGP